MVVAATTASPHSSGSSWNAREHGTVHSTAFHHAHHAVIGVTIKVSYAVEGLRAGDVSRQGLEACQELSGSATVTEAYLGAGNSHRVYGLSPAVMLVADSSWP